MKDQGALRYKNMPISHDGARYTKIQPVVWALIFLLLPLQRYVVINPASKATWNLSHLFLGAALLAIYSSHWKLRELGLGNLKLAAGLSLFVVGSWVIGSPEPESLRATVMLLLIIWSGPPLYHFIRYHRVLAVSLLIMGLTTHSLWAITQFSLQSDLNFQIIGETPIELGQPGIATFTNLSGIKIIRAYGPYPHPNVLAGSMVLGLIVLIHHYRGRRQVAAAPFLIMSYFLSFALILSFSRTGWIGAAIAYLVACLTKTEVVRVFLLLITIIVCAPLLLSRVPAMDEAALVERRDGIADARALLQQLPIWRGTGPGNYEHRLTEYFNQRKITHEVWQVAPVHNAPLLLMVEIGFLPTLILGLALLYFYARPFSRTWPLLLPIIPLLWFDHYLLTQASSLLYLVTVVLLLAAEPDPSPLAAFEKKSASVDQAPTRRRQ